MASASTVDATAIPPHCAAAVTSKPSVFLPKEHGSWSLAFEPLALGLLVAPSAGGAALALATTAAFFARRPLKAAIAGAPQQRVNALWAVLLFTVCIGTGLGEAAMLGGASALWPLMLAAPFGGLFMYFDAQGDSRATAAELAGCATFALLPAALATLDGWSVPAALALAAIAATRSIPTVLTIRSFLRVRKGKPAAPCVPLLAAALAFVTIALLVAMRQAPWLAVCGAALLLIRTGWFVSSLKPRWTAKRAGLVEAFLGVIYITLIAWAYQA